MIGDADDLRAYAGLCSDCEHAIVRPTRRGTVYLRCGRAATDNRYPKYPALPTTICPGYEPPQFLPFTG